MDALTERTCPDCQGTGAWSEPGNCRTCGGGGAIARTADWHEECGGPICPRCDRCACEGGCSHRPVAAATHPADSFLGPIRERAAHAERVLKSGGNFGEAAARSQRDVPRLLAAVEAALKLADEWAQRLPGDPVNLPSLGVAIAIQQDCGAKFREAIGAALAEGEGES